MQPRTEGALRGHPACGFFIVLTIAAASGFPAIAQTPQTITVSSTTLKDGDAMPR